MIPDVSASCATSSLTRTFPFPSHVTLTVLVCVMATRLDSSLSLLTVSRLCFLLISGYVDLSFSRFSLRSYVTRTIRLSTFPPIRLYSCLVLLWFLRLFVLVPYRLVYILGWRWDDPHLQSTLQPP